MPRKISITVTEVVARWARKEAAEKNTSVSKLVGRILEEEMLRRNEYWEAYRKWKKLKLIKGFDASKRLSRDEVHERRPVI